MKVTPRQFDSPQRCVMRAFFRFQDGFKVKSCIHIIITNIETPRLETCIHDSRTYRDIMTASVAVNHAGMLGIMLAHIVMKAEASRTYLILASLEPLSSGLVSSPVEQCAQLVVNQTIMTDFYTLIYLHDSLIGLLIQRTILSDLTPIMSDFNASNSKHTIS